MNILRSTLTCLIQTGESCCLRFVGDSRADVIRVHAFLPLWEESVDAYRRRLKAAAAHVNEMFDVDGLCRELPQRLKALRQTGGDRIAK